MTYDSNLEEEFSTFKNPGGTLLGISGKWSGKVESNGNDKLGRWSWANLRGKKGKIIKVISAYRVYMAHPSQADELTSCKQQVRSLIRRGIKNPNPKKIFLEDLSSFIKTWRKAKKK